VRKPIKNWMIWSVAAGTRQMTWLQAAGFSRAAAGAALILSLLMSPIAVGFDIYHAPRWPSTAVAQRDFKAAALVIDGAGGNGHLWLISPARNGVAQALEFFSGERVENVQVSPDGKRFTFSDGMGRTYDAVKAYHSNVDASRQDIWAGWEKGGSGHDVILGIRLGDASVLGASFSGQRMCEKEVYVVATRESRLQNAEAGFVPSTKVLADFDNDAQCWTTRPSHAANLMDNTFLFVTRDRVFRIRSKDLTPAGFAPALKLIDIKDKGL
jgi:hypothetical protein